MSDQKGSSNSEKALAAFQIASAVVGGVIASPPQKIEPERYDPYAVPAYVDQLASSREKDIERYKTVIDEGQEQNTISGSPPKLEEDDEYEDDFDDEIEAELSQESENDDSESESENEGEFEDEDFDDEIEAELSQESENDDSESESESESEDGNEESE